MSQVVTRVYDAIGGSKVSVWLRQLESLCLRRESLARRKETLGITTQERCPALFKRLDEVTAAIDRLRKGKLLSPLMIDCLVERTADEVVMQTTLSSTAPPLVEFIQRQSTLWLKVGEHEHVGLNGSRYRDIGFGSQYEIHEPPQDEHTRLYQQRRYWWAQYVILKKQYGYGPHHQGPWRVPEDQMVYGEVPVPVDAHGSILQLSQRINECAVVLGVIDSRMEELKPEEPHYRVERRYHFRR